MTEPIYIIFFGALALAFILTLIIKQVYRIKENREIMMTEQGFTRLKEPDNTLLERKAFLNPQTKRVSFYSIFKRHGSSETYYFIKFDTGGNHSTSRYGVMVIFSQIRFPKITIVPKLDIKGIWGKMANNLINKLVGRNLPQINNLGNAEFDRKIAVYGLSDHDVRQVMNNDIMEALAKKDGYFHIEMDYDTMFVSFLNIRNNSTYPLKNRQSFQDYINTIYSISRIFKRSSIAGKF